MNKYSQVFLVSLPSTWSLCFWYVPRIFQYFLELQDDPGSSVLTFTALVLESAFFPKDSCFFQWRIVSRSKDLGARCTPCYWCFIVSWNSLAESFLINGCSFLHTESQLNHGTHIVFFIFFKYHSPVPYVMTTFYILCSLTDVFYEETRRYQLLCHGPEIRFCFVLDQVRDIVRYNF